MNNVVDNKTLTQIVKMVTEQLNRRGPGRPKGSKNKVAEKIIEKGRDPIVPDDVFVKAHEKSETIKDMIPLLPQLKDLSYKKARSYIVAHASYLRKIGVSLKYFQRGRPAHES